ncbi:MAG: PIN domain-containing protein [Thermomicrobiales bacterium]|nr:PIN domain-containing protein [Thermomicrobiales bacterium]
MLDRLRSGQFDAVISVLSLTELLVVPARSGKPFLVERTENLIRAIPNLRLIDVDADIARVAAILRARHRLRTADAVLLATSLHQGATAFVTYDFRLKAVTELEILMLDDDARASQRS